jgi:hypothetical protein
MYKQLIRKKHTLQYISDLHVDIHKTIPKINVKSKYLAICGDIGNPKSRYWDETMCDVSKKFEKIFFVPGNHDYDLGCIYKKENDKYWTPIMSEICNKYKNIYLIDKTEHFLEEENIIIGGCTLWSDISLYNKIMERNYYEESMKEHKSQVKWLSEFIKKNPNKKKVVLTHFVPTFKLIEEKYKKMYPKKINFFATNLENLMCESIIAWLSGHTHSVIDHKINGVYCGINAYGYEKRENTDCVIDLQHN